MENENGETRIFVEVKDNIQKLVQATNNIVISEEDEVLQQRLNEANTHLAEVEDGFQGTNVVHKFGSNFEEKKHESGTPEKPRIMKKVKNLAGGVYEGIKTAAKEIYDEADMAMTSGPLSATSYGHLVSAERAALNNNLELGVTADINVGDGKSIRTICFQAARYHTEVKTPLVMLHGMGGGLPTYHKNFRHLHEDREVYAIDLPGFALSSRVVFLGGAKECTNMFVEIIDKWRQKVRLDQFILLGHSFGGYIASSYAVKHPERVEHLVLLDPWGILPKEEDAAALDKDMWQKGAMELSHMAKSNPFSMLRRTGPLAPLVGDIFISDRMKTAYGDSVTSYFVHAIIQDSLATGERAFSTISGYEYLWAKFPMKYELIKLDDSISITFIYGKDSPFSSNIGKSISEKRENVFVPDPIPDAGHHVHAEHPEEVHKIIKTVFVRSDGSDSGDRRISKWQW